MAKKENIFKICGVCGGDGIVTGSSPIPPHNEEDTPCPSCDGKGGNLFGWIEKE